LAGFLNSVLTLFELSGAQDVVWTSRMDNHLDVSRNLSDRSKWLFSARIAYLVSRLLLVGILTTDEGGYMPFKSEAQRRYFEANKGKLQKQGVDVKEREKTKPGPKVPERVPRKKSRGKSSQSV
jgi:hypothetical protein